MGLIDRILKLKIILIVSGCGASSIQQNLETLPTERTTSSILEDHSHYFNAQGNLKTILDIQLYDDLPASGAANYTGSLLTVIGTDALGGTLIATIDFAGQSATEVAAYGLIDQHGSAYDGSLSGTGVFGPHTSGQLLAIIGGTISSAEGETQTATLALDGNFIAIDGVDAATIAGSIDGVFDSNLASGTFILSKN